MGASASAASLPEHSQAMPYNMPNAKNPGTPRHKGLGPKSNIRYGMDLGTYLLNDDISAPSGLNLQGTGTDCSVEADDVWNQCCSGHFCKELQR